jgi:hypothetical protein
MVGIKMMRLVTMELVSSDSETFHFLAFLSPIKLLDPIQDQ